eukprot:gb/GFBE01011657.1/.p1 GENE.gb/GFBE01011657.1/~~gb/GFBE01011657.1/.p1  ORF type:complete len:164 (+),score=36.34 gb/GFBE01011657.1/:1-492(+)
MSRVGFLLFAMLAGVQAGSHGGHDDHDHDHELERMPNGSYVCPTCGWIYTPSGTETFQDGISGNCPYCGTKKTLFTAWDHEREEHDVICLNSTYHEMETGMVMKNSDMDEDPCHECLGFPCVGETDHSGHDHDDHSGHDHTNGVVRAAGSAAAALLAGLGLLA